MVSCVTGGPGPEHHRLSHEQNGVQPHHGAHRFCEHHYSKERLRQDRRLHVAAPAGARSVSPPRLVLKPRTHGPSALDTHRQDGWTVDATLFREQFFKKNIYIASLLKRVLDLISSCRYFGMFERSAARCSGGPVLLFSAGALHGLHENSPFPINYRCLLLGGGW